MIPKDMTRVAIGFVYVQLAMATAALFVFSATFPFQMRGVLPFLRRPTTFFFLTDIQERAAVPLMAGTACAHGLPPHGPGTRHRGFTVRATDTHLAVRIASAGTFTAAASSPLCSASTPCCRHRTC